MINVLNTEVSFYRNLKDYKFVPKLEQDKAIEIVEKVTPVLTSKLTKSSESNSTFVNKSVDLWVTLNEGEHIKISSKKCGFNLHAYDEAKAIEELLKSKLSLSYNDEYGYLMSDVTLLGNGLVIKSCVNLYNLNRLNKIEQVKQNMRKLGFGLTHVGGNVFELSTTCALGFSESEILSEFEKVLTKLVDLELESLKIVELNHRDEMIDASLRSEAVLNSAYLIKRVQLDADLSMLINGVNMGTVKVEDKIIHELYKLYLSHEPVESIEDFKNLAKKVKSILKGGKNV